MEGEVEPIVNRYWMRGEFPYKLILGLRQLDVMGMGYKGYGCAGRGNVLEGFIALEMARVDASIATFYGVHSGLAMGSIYLCGSEEQKQRCRGPSAGSAWW
jgi:glutaryl-CoA dehydrogenase